MTTATLIFRRDVPGSRSWAVYEGDLDRFLGTVTPYHLPSHIRRGRTQVSPWWAAYDREGRRVDAPDPWHWRPDRRVDLWQTRAEAAAVLAEYPAA